MGVFSVYTGLEPPAQIQLVVHAPDFGGELVATIICDGSTSVCVAAAPAAATTPAMLPLPLPDDSGGSCGSGCDNVQSHAVFM